MGVKCSVPWHTAELYDCWPAPDFLFEGEGIEALRSSLPSPRPHNHVSLSGGAEP